jgi:phosphoglycerol transferase MdoB-like AlkP superfamily enzyme
MWLENHLGWVLVALVVWGSLVSFVFNRILAQKAKPTKLKNYLSWLYLPLLFLFLRGSLGTFPLRLENCYVSTDMEINACTPNGFFMLINAFKEKGEAFSHLSPEESLKQAGFKSIEEALSVYFDQPVDTIKKYPVEHWLYPHTSKKDLKPLNVVLILTESWSNHLMEFNRTDKFDLLGPMTKHLKEDLLFRNFQSSGNCTIDCVEMVSVNTPYNRLFTSKYKNTPFPTSIALPFNAAGYNSEFISGIDISWRNLYTVLPHQGFKRVVGKYDILKERPASKTNRTWGVYDHDMLGYVADRLTKSKTPQFYMCLTSTSHTPFQFPLDFKLPPLTLTDSILHYFTMNKAESLEYLTGYQYESWALGRFMDRLKASPLKDNTVVVITGDHNIRKLIDYSGEKFLNFQHSVPLYVYLPPAIRGSLKVDEQVYGAHSDILPTLAPLLLSDVPYFALGQNLFDAKLTEKGSVSINQAQVIHSDNLTDAQANQKAKAREAILKWLFGKVLSDKK